MCSTDFPSLIQEKYRTISKKVLNARENNIIQIDKLSWIQ